MSRPNVLWIFFDELRTDALQCYPNPRIAIDTPAVAGLAERGVVFEECYANSPVCVPSRTAMLTGLHPERTGVYHNEAYVPGYPLHERPITVPEVLAGAGYRTAAFGKEHVPQVIQPWQVHNPQGAGMRAPLQGFSEDELGLLRTAGQGMPVGGTYPQGRRYPATQVTENAISWLESAPEPFLLFASYLQPHTPVVAPYGYSTRYAPSAFGAPRNRPQGLSAFERRFAELGGGLQMPVEDVDRANACYYGLVNWLDTQVAELLAALRRLRLEDRTVVVLASDHGAYAGEEGAFAKHTFAPQVQRVPLIVSDPGRGTSERRSDLAQLIDLPRTLCGLVDVEPVETFEGRDLFAEPEPAMVFSTIGYGAARSRAFPNRGSGTYWNGRGWPRRSCVRTKRHRLDLTVRIDGRPPVGADEEDVFLCDREADPAEIENRAGDPALAGVLSDLRGRLDTHLEGAVETPDELIYGMFDTAMAALHDTGRGGGR